MDINAVMTEVGSRMKEITGLRVYDWPVGKLDGPSCIVSYPDGDIDYNLAYGRGGCKINDLPVFIAYPRPGERATRLALMAWCASAGPLSVRERINNGRWTSCDDVTVTGCTFDAVRIGDIDYMAAMFKLDVIGGGA